MLYWTSGQKSADEKLFSVTTEGYNLIIANEEK